MGCGPAGATAARVAAERGLSVMMIDRRRSVGTPPRCAGYVPSWVRTRTDVDDSAIIQGVDGFRVLDGQGGMREVVAPGYILDRTRFDKNLAIHALEAGADLAQALVLRRDGMGVVGRRNGLEAAFGAQFLLGADGPSSVIGRSIGLANQRFYVSLQYEVGIKKAEAWLAYYLTEELPGIAWFVPCGNTARIGVGLRRTHARHLKYWLNHFMARLVSDGHIYEGVLGATGGLLPVNGPLEKMQAEGVLLAGDAGGLSEPFCGGGVALAIMSGECAGGLISKAHETKLADVVAEYDDVVQIHLPHVPSFGLDDPEHMIDRLVCMAEWLPSEQLDI
ncbi:MAG: NAD(P)/FAD-dependent oxidoreductase [Candidatus Latescibacteria bacterium]|nr:NAD(P)/FAD-dependent oxidoreductase [Candidatus Latescibacterota bacterium]MBT5829710.1 NAD(P)/FAD-dependent oxidoreductase [Candidatus Latescibacterota bacterium]